MLHMPVRYIPSQGWIFDTPVEAAQFFRLVKGEVPVTVTKHTGHPPAVQATFVLPNNGKKLLLKLLRHPEGVPGRDLADYLGVKPSELGNVVLGIARWGAGYEL